MARTVSFTKRSLITKANSTMVAATATAAFLVVFALISSKTLISQAAYQNRVINGKKTALNQLKSNLSAKDTLLSSYQSFESGSQNILGGNPTGTGQQDGNNTKLILDALPSKYDFPALAATLEKMLASENLQILSISGTDQQLTQQSAQTTGSPVPVPMPFQFEVSGSYQTIQGMIALFEHSIRPFQIQTLSLAGTNSSMTATVSAQTYYQPSANVSITKQVVQ